MLGIRINDLRRCRGWSQVELANRLGISKQTVSNWENDNIQPSIEMLVRLAKLFDVTTDYLLGLNNCIQLNVDGLPPELIAHLSLIVDDFKKQSQK